MRLDLDSLAEASSDVRYVRHELRRVFCPACRYEYHRETYAEEVVAHWNCPHIPGVSGPPRVAVEMMPIAEVVVEVEVTKEPIA